jgi:hypothetical protein
MVEIQTRFSSPKRQRQTNHINRKPAGNLYHAVRIADAIGTPLNVFVTINFNLTDCHPEGMSDRFEALRCDYFGPWTRRPPRKLKRERDPCAYVWVLENAGGCANLHWLLHVPADRKADFAKRLPQWLAAIGVQITDDAAILIEPAAKPKVLAYYLLKGINPPNAGSYGVKFCSPQGTIVGKRSGFSRSLGPTVKARLRAEGQYRRRVFIPFPTNTPHKP